MTDTGVMRGRKRPTLAAILASFALLGALAPATAPSVAQAAYAGPTKVAGGLKDPAAFAFAPDGRIFYGERATGEIHILAANGSSDSLFFTIPNVVSNGEQGVLGIAIDPGYPGVPHVFVYATRMISGQERNQILRVTDTAGSGGGMIVLWSSPTTAGVYHDGGHIAFGPDGKLWAVVGEGHSPANAQKLTNDAGKVIRMNPDGSAPGDNPFAGKLIWSYGLRNSFGFSFDPANGRLWESENGPECNDEINRILKGRNFGWGPSETCGHPPATPQNTNQDGPKPVLPKIWFTPTVAPTGLAFCNGCGLGAKSEGRIFFGEYDTGDIMRVNISADRKTIVGHSVFYSHSDGIRSLQAAPDGTLYFSDSTSIWHLT